MDRIWEKVKENRDKLKSCNRHEFSIDLDPEMILGKKWKCKNCLGTLDTVNKSWYEKGLTHGKDD